MKISRVLFIIPPALSTCGNVRPSPAIAYLSEYLENNSIQTRVFDLNVKHKSSPENLIRDFSPQLIGYSMFSFNYKNNYNMINKLKGKFPDILSIAGGSHISTWREKVLQECEGLDFAATMEGEKTILELCNGKEPKEILGLIYRENGEVVFNGDRPFIEELDEIPFPRYKRFNMGSYIKERLIFSSRGCPYLCSFCPNHLVIGRKMRFRSPKNIVDEMEYWYSTGTRQFDFQDDNFTMDKKRVYMICDEIEKRGLKNLFLRCSNGIRADRTDYDLLKRMKEVGFQSVGLGVESATNAVLKEMKKSVTIEVIEEAIKNLCKLDYDVHLFFLVGMPKETKEDLKKTEELALKYPILRANFYNPKPFPGTALFDYLTRNNLLLKDYKDYLNINPGYTNEPVFETPELSAEDRVECLKHFKKVEKLIMKKSFHRRLKYLGPLSKIASALFVTNTMQRMIFNNLAIRKLADKYRYKYIINSR